MFESQGQPFNGNTLSSNFYRAVRTKKRGNLKINFKSLRTSFINILRDAGVKDTAIQEMVGHAELSTTRGHYFITTRKQRKELEKIVDDISNGINFSAFDV